ncbi:MAG: hypothetical protein ACRDWV_01650 [Acidimicrobiales bacterium]
MRVLPNLPALDRPFDYVVPPGWAREVVVGTRVRVALGPRRVGGWVIEVDVVAADGVVLRPMSTHSGLGPSPELMDLASWAAWRWAGSRARFLVTASPESVVRSLPSPGPGLRRQVPAAAGLAAAAPAGLGAVSPGIVGEALALGRAVLRLAPAIDPLPLLEDVLSVLLVPDRSVLVLAPSHSGATSLASRLQVAGWPVALMPSAWGAAAAGGRVVVGTRAGAWAPAPSLAGVVVLDAHDDAYRGESTPSWVAWRIAAERAAREDSPCLLVTPCPTQEVLSWGRLVTDSRSAERRGWAALEVIDRRGEDPRSGLFSDRLVAVLKTARGEPGGQVVCVLNRKGRARLLACGTCGELIRCEHCAGPMHQLATQAEGPAVLTCRLCGRERPEVCGTCGSIRMKALRLGVSRVREELSALTELEVSEVSGPPKRLGAGFPEGAVPDGSAQSAGMIAPIVVGTEAVLHRIPKARAAAFLDMDQELLFPGFRAGESALALLARASRMVGGRETGGRVVVQTRLPRHEVISAAMHADPDRLARVEAGRRRALKFPPFAALALISGPMAEGYVAELRSAPGGTAIQIRGPERGSWLVRAPSHQVLCDALAATPRPRGRLRVEVDPIRL